MRFASPAILSVLSLTLCACATEPPPCTAEWVEWRTDRVLREFASDNRSGIADLRELGLRIEQGGEQAIPDLALGSSIVQALGLAARFLEEAVPAVQEAVGQCGSAPRAAQLFADMLRQEGVGENVARAVERLGAFAEEPR